MDHNLLIIVDMILNNEKWVRFLGMSPEDLFNSKAYGRVPCEINNFCVINSDDQFDLFQSTYKKMKLIINKDLTESKDDPTLYKYYIMKYRLQNNNEGNQLCDQLRENLNQFLIWTRNGGLVFLGSMINKNKNIALEKLSTNEICNFFDVIQEQYCDKLKCVY